MRTYAFLKVGPSAARLEDKHGMVRIFRETPAEHEAGQASADDDKVIRIGDVVDDVACTEQVRLRRVLREGSSERDPCTNGQSGR